MMDRPAFCVSEGIIRTANQAALSRMVVPGSPVSPLITAGQADYDTFSSGCLYLTLYISGHSWSASVTRMGEMDIFSIDPEEDPELRAFALAAQELRQPLSQILSISDHLFPTLTQGEDTVSDQLALINRSLYRMLRLVGNMSDAGTAGIARTELVDLTAVFQEIFDRAQQLCQQAGVTLSFTNHPAPVYSVADSQKLERAVYNLISNILKYAESGGPIQAQLTRRGNTLYLSVTDNGREPIPLSHGTAGRYHREPGFGYGRSGLGLGLMLVRSAAAAHRGALLLDHPKTGGNRATISIPIVQNTDILRSPGVRIDYAGERDHGLIELSDALPPELYAPKKN